MRHIPLDKAHTFDLIPYLDVINEVLEAVIRDLEVEVVAELTPTDLSSGEPGIRHIRACLEAGCHVTTTNKGPVALAWQPR